MGAALRDAITAVLSRQPSIVQGGSIPEDSELLWGALVAAELRDAGWCAKGGGRDRLSRDEVAIWADGRRAHFDVCVASGAPPGRCLVGPEIRFLIATGVEAGGGGGPLPSPPPPDQVCTAAGITEGGELKRFPSLQAACSERLAVTVAQGHLEAHVSGGEPWYRDTGMGGGWYDARCDRYDSPGGRKLAGPEWFGVRCQP